VNEVKEVKGPRLKNPTPPTKKLAAAVLDVLGGARTPVQAAEALEVSLVRYYALEKRAIHGLLTACEPLPKGPRTNSEKEISKLNAEVERLKRECDRRQSLLRAAQRAIGLVAPPAKPRGKRRRKPMARALVMARVLRSQPEAAEETPAATP